MLLIGSDGSKHASSALFCLFLISWPSVYTAQHAMIGRLSMWYIHIGEFVNFNSVIIHALCWWC